MLHSVFLTLTTMDREEWITFSHDILSSWNTHAISRCFFLLPLYHHTVCLLSYHICQLPHVWKTGACVWTPPQLCISRKTCSFGFAVRHIRAYRQDARTHPILSHEQRSQGHIPRPDQIRMKGVMTLLTHKEQALTRAIIFGRMPTHGTRFRIVGVHFDRHTAMQEGFIGNHALQLGKRPRTVSGVPLTLLFTRLFAFLASGTLSNVGQVLKANERVRRPLNNPLTHDMISVLRSPVSPVQLSSQVALLPNGCLLFADAFSVGRHDWPWQRWPYQNKKYRLLWS